MKRIIIAIIAFSGVFSNAFASDFFLDNIDGNQVRETRIQNVKLWSYTFINKATTSKYRDTLYFIFRVKTAAIRKLENGTLDRYAFDTVAEELENFGFFMDTYFQNMKAYEKTGRKTYRDLANENMQDAKASYERLKAFTLSH